MLTASSGYFSSPVNGVEAKPLELSKASTSPLGMLTADLNEALNVSESMSPRRKLFSNDEPSSPGNPFLFQSKPSRVFARVATCAARIEGSKSPTKLFGSATSLFSDNQGDFDEGFHKPKPKTASSSLTSTFNRPPLIPGPRLGGDSSFKPKSGLSGTSHWNNRKPALGSSFHNSKPSSFAAPRSVLDISVAPKPPSADSFNSKKRDRLATPHRRFTYPDLDDDDDMDDRTVIGGSPMRLDFENPFANDSEDDLIIKQKDGQTSQETSPKAAKGLFSTSPKALSRPPVKVRRTLSVTTSSSWSSAENESVLTCSPTSEVSGDISAGVADLPHTVTERDALKRISCSTLVDLLSGRFNDICDDVHIIDCRYPYEYEGGHIAGARNVFTTGDLTTIFYPSSNRPVSLVQRAPRMALFLRNHDRNLNMDRYPFLDFPNIYVLQGGYKAFFGENKMYCEPQFYVEMKDERFSEDLKKYVTYHMEWLFGSRKTPAELLKQHQRALQKAQRDLDRERTKLEQQEKKLIADIKKSAKANQMNACKIMAKDLVRTRRYIQKFYQMKTQLQAVSLRIQTMRSNQAMADAMKGVTKAMRSMNKNVNMPEITKIMMDFEKESEMMDMKEEMMNDAIDDVMEEDADEAEEDAIVNQVLDEIGISLNQAFADTPGNKFGQKAAAEAQPEPMLADDDDLQARLANLRKG
ncbi:Charged multivesicular body protein 2A [Phlyctochytrium planicorne]|nr:Charged multivesicular body protein 2A [Phlyctochytrium planicorne]